MATVKNNSGRENCGRWLAVINGRFLPVKELSVTEERERIVNDNIMSVEVTTRRNPCLGVVAGRPRGQAIFINRKYKIIIEKPVATTISESSTESSKEWTVDLQGVGYDFSEW